VRALEDIAHLVSECPRWLRAITRPPPRSPRVKWERRA
jgi:hypothetical protein